MGKAYFEPRKFNGKTFRYHGSSATKAKAKERAAKLRSQGYYARVITTRDWGGRGYEIFKRKKAH